MLSYDDVTNVDSVGIITAQNDVVIADKIIHLGDTNTAIRFPAADTITAETGGSERVRIDTSGRLLIGTTSGGARLTVGAVSDPSTDRGAVAIKAVSDATGIPANLYLQELLEQKVIRLVLTRTVI